MYNRLVEFAKLAKYSLDTNVLIHLLNKISSAIDQHGTTVGIFFGSF